MRIENGVTLPHPIHTSLHVCCNHFMKTTTKDINQYFPIGQSSNVVRGFLKETLAMFLNLSDLTSIVEAFHSLSIILKSKYITEDVTTAINAITLLVIDIDSNGHRIENLQPADKDEKDTSDADIQDEILYFDEPEDDSMYKKSRFYQKFKEVTFKGQYDNTATNKLNNFYCPEYCELLLKKYMSILPLWTCLNNRKRFSNANSEALFSFIKQRLTLQAPVIGRIPIRAARFYRFSRIEINATIDDFYLQLPRENCCGRKQTKKLNIAEKPIINTERSSSLSDQTTPTTRKRKNVCPSSNNSKKQKLALPSTPTSSTSYQRTPRSSRLNSYDTYSPSFQLKTPTGKRGRPRLTETTPTTPIFDINSTVNSPMQSLININDEESWGLIIKEIYYEISLHQKF